MRIVYEVSTLTESSHLCGKQEDTLALTWEQRRWVRGKFRTTQGREIALALPTGTPLEPGAVVLIEEDWYVRVEPVPEALLAVTPRDHAESIKLAFEIGNRHFPLALDGHSILVPEDRVMMQLFNRLGAAYERRTAVFSPIGNGFVHGGSAYNEFADGR